MKYLSVCSGVEAASKAWEPLGWQPVAFSEIEPFPSAVLKHHWPEVQNLGDMTKYEQWTIPSGTVDLLVGGTPCQSFSVAGLRKGLHDPRGGLMLTFLEIAQRIRPRWVVWENVPGVLSSNGGRDFGSFLGALGELGYGWSYRVLDAQWFGVAQRRRRVFVVGHLGNWELAAKVLFESESVRRDTPPSREKGKGVAANAQEGVGVSLPEREVIGCLSDGAHMGGGLTAKTHTAEELWQSQAYRMQAFGEYMNDETASAMKARDYKDATDLVASPVVIDRAAFNQGENAQYRPHIEHSETMDSLVARGPHAVLFENHPNDSRVTGPHEVAPSCVSRFGTGGGNIPLVQEGVDLYNQAITGDVHCPLRTAGGHGAPAVVEAIAFEPGIASREGNESRFVKEMSPTLRKDMGDNQVAVAFQESELRLTGKITEQSVCPTLKANTKSGDTEPKAVDNKMAVRRLTPKECERLQGFPDDHTLIPWRNKPADQCPDGPRYKALGNSMAVPCMAWIGKRIDAADRGNRKANQ